MKYLKLGAASAAIAAVLSSAAFAGCEKLRFQM